jgi:hypothetical protein
MDPGKASSHDPASPTKTLSLPLLRLGSARLACRREAAQRRDAVTSPRHPANHVIMALYARAE